MLGPESELGPLLLVSVWEEKEEVVRHLLNLGLSPDTRCTRTNKQPISSRPISVGFGAGYRVSGKKKPDYAAYQARHAR